MASTHYLEEITIKSLRDYILDASITDSDTILLNQVNFDNIILEYRDTYEESIALPFLLLGVLIKEDETNYTSKNSFKVIKDDMESERTIIENTPSFSEPIYRCGWCGSITDYDGRAVSKDIEIYNISILEKYPDGVETKSLNGYCCKKQWHPNA